MGSTSPRYDSYVDYVGSLLPRWPEYRGLYGFLRFDSHPSADVRAMIVDSSADKISTRRFVNPTQFKNALGVRSSTTKTRVIILHYQRTETFHRGFVDALGLNFDIDPLFLSNHFSTALLGETHMKEEKASTGIYAQLSSQRTSLDLGHSPSLHASIMFLDATMHEKTQQSTGMSE